MTREEKIEYKYLMKRRMLHEKLLCFILGGVSVAGLVIIIEAASYLLNGKGQNADPTQEQRLDQQNMRSPYGDHGRDRRWHEDNRGKRQDEAQPKPGAETVEAEVSDEPVKLAVVDSASVQVTNTTKKNEVSKSRTTTSGNNDNLKKNDSAKQPVAGSSQTAVSVPSDNNVAKPAESAPTNKETQPKQNAVAAIPGIDATTAQDLADAANALREVQQAVGASKQDDSASANSELIAAAAALLDAEGAIKPTSTKPSFQEVKDSQAEAEKLAAETKALFAADEAWRAQNAAARASSSNEAISAAQAAANAASAPASPEQKSYKASTKVDMKNAAPLTQAEVATNAKAAGKCVIACYTETPQKSKTFVYTLFVNSSGRVSDYSADSSSMITTQGFERCIDPCLKKIAFSAFGGGSSPRVTYTITVSEK